MDDTAEPECIEYAQRHVARGNVRVELGVVGLLRVSKGCDFRSKLSTTLPLRHAAVES